MSSFDISQYTIEISMENDESETTTSETVKLYPKLEKESEEENSPKRVTFEEDACEDSAVCLKKEEAKEEVVFVKKQIASIEGSVIYSVEPTFGVTLTKPDAMIDLPAPTKRRVRKKVKKVESEERELPVVSQPEKIVAAIPDELMYRARKSLEAQAEAAEERKLAFFKRNQVAVDKDEEKSQETIPTYLLHSSEPTVQLVDQPAETDKPPSKDLDTASFAQIEVEQEDKEETGNLIVTEALEEQSMASDSQAEVPGFTTSTTSIEVSVELDTVVNTESKLLVDETVDPHDEVENAHCEDEDSGGNHLEGREEGGAKAVSADVNQSLNLEAAKSTNLDAPPSETEDAGKEKHKQLLDSECTKTRPRNEHDQGEEYATVETVSANVQEEDVESAVELQVENYSAPGPEVVEEEEETSFEQEAENIEIEESLVFETQEEAQKESPGMLEKVDLAENEKSQEVTIEKTVQISHKETGERKQEPAEQFEEDKLTYTATTTTVAVVPVISDIPEEDTQSEPSLDKDEVISIKENIISINISPSPREETSRRFFDNSEYTSSHAIQDDIISLEEVADSLPEDNTSIKNFTIPEPVEDGEPWNRWLFTQLRYIWENYSEKIAIVEEVGETRCISYGELMDGVMRTANYLQHHGVGEETVVGFCMESTFEFLLYELACFFLGAVPVIFRPSQIASDHITPINLKVMITDAEHYGHVLRSHAFFGELQQVFVLTDDIRTLYLPRNVWTIDGLGFLDFNCDIPLHLGKSPKNVVTFSTSGTPSSRGKVVSHSAQSSKAICTHYYTELISLLKEKHPEEKVDVHLVTTGLHTIDGFSYAIYSLIHGGTLILTEANADVWKVSFLDRIAGLIERYKIPMLMVHSQFLKCFSKYEIHKIYNMESLKLLCHSGSCLPPSVIENIRELGMSTTQAYITTETGAFSLEDVTSSNVLIPTCGEPFVGNNVKILELEGDNEVAPGKWGRLWVQGPTLFSEYLCEAKFAENSSAGWFFTGDIASLDEQARLYVAGPAEGVVKGANGLVPLVEAEIILSDLMSIDDIAITKLKDELVTGIVLVEGEVPPSVGQINSTLQERGLKLKIDRLTVVDFIPRSETGKLIRGDLPFLFEIEPETEIETEAELDVATNIPEENESSL